jgi:hypothetical protein
MEKLQGLENLLDIRKNQEMMLVDTTQHGVGWGTVHGYFDHVDLEKNKIWLNRSIASAVVMLPENAERERILLGFLRELDTHSFYEGKRIAGPIDYDYNSNLFIYVPNSE